MIAAAIIVHVRACARRCTHARRVGFLVGLVGQALAITPLHFLVMGITPLQKCCPTGFFGWVGPRCTFNNWRSMT